MRCYICDAILKRVELNEETLKPEPCHNCCNESESIQEEFDFRFSETEPLELDEGFPCEASDTEEFLGS